MKFIIKAIPPSYNRECKINYNLKQVYLSKEARGFKNLVFLSTPPMNYREGSIFSISINIVKNWLTKAGKVKREDVQNMDKLLIDAICEKLGFDDSLIYNVSIKKTQSDTEAYTEIELIEKL